MNDEKTEAIHSRRTRPLWKWSVVFIVLLISGLMFFLLSPKEPEYRGRTLSQCLKELDRGAKLNWFTQEFDLDENAAQPIREMGEQATPHLVRRLKSGLSYARWYDRLAGSSFKLPFKLFGAKIDRMGVAGREAMFGFQVLGERASGAVPELAKLVETNGEDSGAGSWIFSSLAFIGSPATLTLSNALLSTNFYVRDHAAQAVGSLGAHGEPLVPLLVSLLADTNAVIYQRCAAARSLGRIGKPPETIRQILCSYLSSTNSHLRGNACLGLMLMGKEAEPAIVQLDDRLKTEGGKLDKAVLVAFVILSDDDKRITAALEKNSHFASPANFSAAFAQMRNGRKQGDRNGREAMVAALEKIQPKEGSE